MKAKIHSVKIPFNNKILFFLVWAQTKQGAIRNAMEVLAATAEADIATGAELYEAGRHGVPIHGADKYARMEDPNQPPLPLNVDAAPVADVADAADADTNEA